MGKEGSSTSPLLWILGIALLVITTTVVIRHGVPMASFRSNSRRPQELTVPAIKFVGEQDGRPERDLKARLVKLFRDKPSVERAYLARTEYGDTTGMQVSLCVVSSNGADESLVSDVSEIFRNMFGPHEHLDIVFVGDDQEQQLRAVCMPFYSRNG